MGEGGPNRYFHFYKVNSMAKKRCMSCGGDIRIYYDHEIGDEVFCEECEREYRICSLRPVHLEPLETGNDYYFEEDDY